MNKQELIDKLASLVGSIEDFKGISTFHDGKYAGLEHALELIKQLDEPQKPVVPKFVAEWIEQAKKERQSLYEAMYNIESSTYYHKYDNATYQWMFEGALHDEHQELFAEVYMHGYEVEKEPLYTVTINLDRKYHLVVDEGDGNDEISTTLTTSHGLLGYRYFLTEKEIKSADENLWLIAVPVEEVVER
ncbi:TPA: DUF1642 domain-containing protein [Enterococcus faecium]